MSGRGSRQSLARDRQRRQDTARSLRRILMPAPQPDQSTNQGIPERPAGAARILGVQLNALYASADCHIDAAFATLLQVRAGGLLIGPRRIPRWLARTTCRTALRHAVPPELSAPYGPAAGGQMKALGLIFPHSILGRADEVID
jgi:hypothetical protein